MTTKTLAYASIDYKGSLPFIKQALNVASVIDHGIGELELVFEDKIPPNHVPWIVTYGTSSYVDYEQPDYDGDDTASMLFTIRSNKDGEPIDSGISVLILGSDGQSD